MVHRSDGSGTSYIFTDYLSKVSPDWKEKVGKATSVNWPVGPGRQGQRGRDPAGEADRRRDRLRRADLRAVQQPAVRDGQERRGRVRRASLASVTAAAASAKFAKNTDFRVSITNAPGKDAYPISSFTWLLVQPDMADDGKAKAHAGLPALDDLAGSPADGVGAQVRAAAGGSGRRWSSSSTLKANGKAIASE